MAPGSHWAIVHMHVGMQEGGKPKTKAPHPAARSAFPIIRTDPAVSQGVPRGLCCQIPHSTEQREGLSQGIPRLTSNLIHGDFDQKTHQIRVSLSPVL